MTFDPHIHKTILVSILKAIYDDEEINQLLGFKGGTALLLFYNLSRFSVDLDFDLLDSSKKDLVHQKLHSLLSEYGILRNSENKRFNLFYLLSYHNKVEGAHNIKVEINTRAFGSIYEQKSYLGAPLKVMVRSDMCAHKLVAMYERMGKAHRDIYDTWFMLSNAWPINPTIITNRTGMTFDRFIETCINKLESLEGRSLLSGLGELITPKQRIWVKEKLLQETIFWLNMQKNRYS